MASSKSHIRSYQDSVLSSLPGGELRFQQRSRVYLPHGSCLQVIALLLEFAVPSPLKGCGFHSNPASLCMELSCSPCIASGFSLSISVYPNCNIFTVLILRLLFRCITNRSVIRILRTLPTHKPILQRFFFFTDLSLSSSPVVLVYN